MIEYQIDSDKFANLPEEQKALYNESDGNYQLNVTGVPKEDVTGLKNKIDELLSEKKTVQQKALEAEEKAQAEAIERMKKAKDYEQLYQSSESEREKASRELSELKAQITKQQVKAQSTEIATTLTKDTQRAKLLSEQIQSRLSLVDGEIRVLDANGNLTVSTVEELTNSIKAEYPFLVDGSQAAGGGAVGGSNSGAGDSKQTMSRSDFDALDQFKRAEFFKKGGKII